MTRERIASEPAPAAQARESYTMQSSQAFDTLMRERNVARDAAFLVPHLRPGMRLLDLRPEMVAAAQVLAGERGVTTVRFQVGDAYQLPFPDGAFDAVFASQVLMHLRDPLAVLKECRRVLAPGGVAGIRDPDSSLNWRLPSTPLLEEMRAVEERVFIHNGASLHYARHLRRYLLETGFARAEASATVLSRGAEAGTRWLAAAWIARFRSAADVAVAQGWVTPAAVERMCEELNEWGERPDAFAVAGPMVEAVGWVDG